MRTPPTFKNLTAHSAVTAGGPKERAVTRSNFPSNSGHRAASSARAIITSPVSGAPGQARTSFRKLLRLPMESRKTSWERQRSRSTSPGKPPPLPRSRRSDGGVGRSASQQRAKPCACKIWGSIGCGPKKPRALDSSRARGNQSLFTMPLCRRDHHEATRVFTF